MMNSVGPMENPHMRELQHINLYVTQHISRILMCVWARTSACALYKCVMHKVIMCCALLDRTHSKHNARLLRNKELKKPHNIRRRDRERDYNKNAPLTKIYRQTQN